YASWRGQKLVRQLGRLYTAWFISIGLLTGAAVLLKVSTDYSRIWVTTTLFVSVSLITTFRVGISLFLRRIRMKGKNLKSVIVVESESTATELDGTLPALTEYGYKVVQRVHLASDQMWLNNLVSNIMSLGAHEVWLRLPLNRGEEIKTILHA